MWYCEPALTAHFEISTEQLSEWANAFALRAKTTVEVVKRKNPKELFEDIVKVRLKRTISPRDFEHIGRRASVAGLLACPSLAAIVQTLRAWFPPEP